MSLRQSHTVCAAVLSVIAGSGVALAQHSDILLEVADGRIVTRNDVTGVEQRVFEASLDESGIPGYGDEPGFGSSALNPGERIGFNVLAALLFWDGAEFGPPAGGESLEIALQGTPMVVVRGDSGPQPGGYFVTATASGGIHTHLTFWVKHPTFDPNDPFDNPIAAGAYALKLEITSDVHAPSEPLFLVFRSGIPDELLDEAVDAAGDLLAPPACAGDVDGDQDVDLTDLATLLTHFGQSIGAARSDGDLDGDGDVDLTNLASLLAVFGTICA